MSYLSGTNGAMFVDGTKAGRVRGWSLNTSQPMMAGTTLGDTDAIPVPGVRSTSGTCDLFYYQATAGSNTGNTASALINKIIKRRNGQGDGVAAPSEMVTFKFLVEDGSSDGKYESVQAYITSAQMQLSVGEVFSAQISFDVIGAPTEMSF